MHYGAGPILFRWAHPIFKYIASYCQQVLQNLKGRQGDFFITGKSKEHSSSQGHLNEYIQATNYTQQSGVIIELLAGHSGQLRV